MKKILILLIFALFIPNVYSWSVTGRVLDQNGGSLPGANVVVSDVNRGIIFGATTDGNGNFVLTNNNIQGSYAVTASFIGYAEKTEFLSSGQNNVFKLREIIYNLPELTVTAQRDPEEIITFSHPVNFNWGWVLYTVAGTYDPNQPSAYEQLKVSIQKSSYKLNVANNVEDIKNQEGIGDECSGNEDCPSGSVCYGGLCIHPDLCQETDGVPGRAGYNDPFKKDFMIPRKGKNPISDECRCATPDGSISASNCANPIHVWEFSCFSDNPITVLCENGCSEGRCNPVEKDPYFEVSYNALCSELNDDNLGNVNVNGVAEITGDEILTDEIDAVGIVENENLSIGSLEGRKEYNTKITDFKTLPLMEGEMIVPAEVLKALDIIINDLKWEDLEGEKWHDKGGIYLSVNYLENSAFDFLPFIKSKGDKFKNILKEKTNFSDEDIQIYYNFISIEGNILLNKDTLSADKQIHERMHKAYEESLTSDEKKLLKKSRDDFISDLKELYYDERRREINGFTLFFIEIGNPSELYTYMGQYELFPVRDPNNIFLILNPGMREDIYYKFEQNFPDAYKIYRKLVDYIVQISEKHLDRSGAEGLELNDGGEINLDLSRFDEILNPEIDTSHIKTNDFLCASYDDGLSETTGGFFKEISGLITGEQECDIKLGYSDEYFKREKNLGSVDTSEKLERIKALVKEKFKPLKVVRVKIYLSTSEEIQKTANDTRAITVYINDENAIYFDDTSTGSEEIFYHEFVHAYQNQIEHGIYESNIKSQTNNALSELIFSTQYPVDYLQASKIVQDVPDSTQKAMEIIEANNKLDDFFDFIYGIDRSIIKRWLAWYDFIPEYSLFFETLKRCDELTEFVSGKIEWKNKGNYNSQSGFYTPNQCENIHEFIAYLLQGIKFAPEIVYKSIQGEFGDREIYQMNLDFALEKNWITREDYDNVVDYGENQKSESDENEKQNGSPFEYVATIEGNTYLLDEVDTDILGDEIPFYDLQTGGLKYTIKPNFRTEYDLHKAITYEGTDYFVRYFREGTREELKEEIYNLRGEIYKREGKNSIKVGEIIRNDKNLNLLRKDPPLVSISKIEKFDGIGLPVRWIYLNVFEPALDYEIICQDCYEGRTFFDHTFSLRDKDSLISRYNEMRITVGESFLKPGKETKITLNIIDIFGNSVQLDVVLDTKGIIENRNGIEIRYYGESEYLITEKGDLLDRMVERVKELNEYLPEGRKNNAIIIFPGECNGEGHRPIVLRSGCFDLEEGLLDTVTHEMGHVIHSELAEKKLWEDLYYEYLSFDDAISGPIQTMFDIRNVAPLSPLRILQDCKYKTNCALDVNDIGGHPWDSSSELFASAFMIVVNHKDQLEDVLSNLKGDNNEIDPVMRDMIEIIGNKKEKMRKLVIEIKNEIEKVIAKSQSSLNLDCDPDEPTLLRRAGKVVAQATGIGDERDFCAITGGTCKDDFILVGDNGNEVDCWNEIGGLCTKNECIKFGDAEYNNKEIAKALSKFPSNTYADNDLVLGLLSFDRNLLYGDRDKVVPAFIKILQEIKLPFKDRKYLQYISVGFDEQEVIPNLLFENFVDYPLVVSNLDLIASYLPNIGTERTISLFLRNLLFNRIYNNPKISTLPVYERGSITFAVFRLADGTEKYYDFVDQMLDFILKKRKEFFDRVIFGPDTSVIPIIGEEIEFSLSGVRSFAIDRGVTKIPDEELKVEKDKTKIKNLIVESSGLTTIWFNVHGTPDDLSEFRYWELGDSLIARGKIDEVTLIFDACYAYDYTQNLIKSLKENGAESLPTVITSANKGKTSTGTIFSSLFLISLGKVDLKKGEPLLGKHIYLAEEFAQSDKFIYTFPGGLFSFRLPFSVKNPFTRQYPSQDSGIFFNGLEISMNNPIEKCSVCQGDDCPIDSGFASNEPSEITTSAILDITSNAAASFEDVCRIPNLNEVKEDKDYKEYTRAMIEKMSEIELDSTLINFENILTTINNNPNVYGNWDVRKLRDGLYSHIIFDLDEIMRRISLNAFNGQIIFFLADGEQSNWEIGSIWTVTPNGQKVETQYQYRYLPEFRTSIKIKDPETGEEEKFGTLEIIDNGRVVNSLLVTNKDFWKYLEKAQQRPFWNYEAYYWNGQDYKLPTKEGKDLQPGEKYSYLYGVDGPGQGNLDEEFREIVAILTTAKVRSLEIDRERLDSLPCGLIFNRCQDVKTHGWDSVGKRIFGLRN